MLPAGYVPKEGVAGGGFALAGAGPWLESILASGSTLYSWAAERSQAGVASGRGRVHFVPTPLAGHHGRGRWAVRHYRRGGILASRFGDRYLWGGSVRPLVELWASVGARARGVRTPAVVAGAVYPAGAFYRADLVTEVVPDSVELADAAFGGTGATSEDALRAAGLLVRQMEAARIVHADLNAHNILLLPTDPRAGAYVVDLDRARALAPGAAAPERVMRRRLERSLRKLERLRGHPLLENDWAALRAGFEGAA